MATLLPLYGVMCLVALVTAAVLMMFGKIRRRKIGTHVCSNKWSLHINSWVSPQFRVSDKRRNFHKCGIVLFLGIHLGRHDTLWFSNTLHIHRAAGFHRRHCCVLQVDDFYQPIFFTPSIDLNVSNYLPLSYNFMYLKMCFEACFVDISTSDFFWNYLSKNLSTVVKYLVMSDWFNLLTY